MIFQIVLCIFVYLFERNVSVTLTLTARGFQNSMEFIEKTMFPEHLDDSLRRKSNVALTFSGGGARSYISALGILAGLNELS